MSGRIGRGFLLAASAAACITMQGRVDWLCAYGLSSDFFVAVAVMMIPGAFLASLPGRIRRRREPREKSSVRGCLSCFLGGIGLMLGAGLAGGGDGLMLTGLGQGSVSAFVFLGASWLAGLIAARLAGRRDPA